MNIGGFFAQIRRPKTMRRRIFFYTLIISAATLFFVVSCGQSINPTLKVKVASLERCGATQPTIDLVTNTAKELGLNIDFQYVAIITPEQAKEHRHLGSPTIQINGLDIEPAARNADQFGIA
jgi:hypothetical protein